MRVMFEIVGYDRATGRPTVSLDVPERRITRVKKIAGIATSDDGLGSYPLTERQVREIAAVLECPIDMTGRDFYVEPYSEKSADRAAN
jgi:hypothetical protein